MRAPVDGARRGLRAGNSESLEAIDLDSFRTHGRFGEVVFYRADFDGEGRMLLTARESYELEKQSNGSVTVRGR